LIRTGMASLVSFMTQNWKFWWGFYNRSRILFVREAIE
jgi:hypothetical protein